MINIQFILYQCTISFHFFSILLELNYLGCLKNNWCVRPAPILESKQHGSQDSMDNAWHGGRYVGS